jgi:hypothetical protein
MVPEVVQGIFYGQKGSIFRKACEHSPVRTPQGTG